MLRSFRDSLFTTAMALTPFLLAACGDDGSNDKKASAALMTMALLVGIVSMTVRRGSAARAG